MRMGVSTACFYPMLTELSLITLLEMGVTELEIFFNTSSELNKKYIKGLRSSLRKYGGKVRSIHPYSSMMEPFMFFSNYERRFNDMMDDYKRYFEAANMLDAELIVIHGDKLPAKTPDEKYFERFNRIIECGKKEGVIVGQENVNLHRSQNPEFLCRMREWIGDDCIFVFDIRQFRIIFGRFGRDGEGSITCPDGNLIVVADNHSHRAFRQTADNITKELGRQNALAGISHFGFNFISNGGFHVVAGKAEAHSGLAEDTFDDGKAALLSDGTARNVQALNQHAFFTGKAHSQIPFLYKE